MKNIPGFPSLRFSPLCFLVAMFFGMALTASADDKGGFKNSAFFKFYLGEWEMEGELKKVDGDVVKIKESWKAEILGEDTLSVTGIRNAQKFSYTFTHNPATGLYEASHQNGDDSGNTLHFEISLSETDLRMDMTALLATNKGKITISESYPDKEHDTIESKIAVTDDAGNTTVSGTLIHKRVKKP
jgi:hypothetical protein